MTENSFLIEIKTDNFSAVVLPFHLCLTEDSGVILRKFFTGDKQGAFEQAFSMFIDCLAPEKVNEFYGLEDRQMVLVVADWLST